jgi:hypothetical protein
MKKINELKDINNNAKIDALTDEERYQWYLRIKESLPLWREIGKAEQLEQAILDYERRHGIS